MLIAILAFNAIFFICMIVVVGRLSSLESRVKNSLLQFTDSTTAKYENIKNYCGRLEDEIEESVNENQKAVRSIGKMTTEVVKLRSDMTTAMKGINRNTKKVFEDLLSAVQENDPVKLSQVIRSAHVLVENFNEVESSFDDFVPEYSVPNVAASNGN